MSFKEWQKTGKDIHSVIADPLFVKPEAYDFHFKDISVARKIKFTPFDYSRAGVYGSDEWKKLAEFDPEKALGFDEMIMKRESIR